MTRQNLESVIGPSGRAGEVLNRQRPLTMTMIRRLHAAYHISPDVLIRAYLLHGSRRGRKSSREMHVETQRTAPVR